MTNKLIRNAIIVASIFGSAVFSGQASAAACKGLQSSACDSNNACSWVEGYQRKDGREVKSFCRSKPNVQKKVSAKASTLKKVTK